MKGEEVNRADIAASFQKAVVDVLVEHTMQAAADFGMKRLPLQEVLLPTEHFALLWKSMYRTWIQILPSVTDLLYG